MPFSTHHVKGIRTRHGKILVFLTAVASLTRPPTPLRSTEPSRFTAPLEGLSTGAMSVNSSKSQRELAERLNLPGFSCEPATQGRRVASGRCRRSRPVATRLVVLPVSSRAPSCVLSSGGVAGKARACRTQRPLISRRSSKVASSSSSLEAVPFFSLARFVELWGLEPRPRECDSHVLSIITNS